jgi:putative colanic acid biosynthesis acetyltransferase WcaF
VSEGQIQVYQNRLSRGNRVARFLWGWVYRLLFRPSPQFFYAWRRMLLRTFGAKIGHGAIVHPSVRIWAPWNLEMDDHACLAFGVDCYCVDKVSLGRRATVSQDAFLCTASHDIHDPATPLVTRPIRIAEGAWVFARAFIGPGVTLGEGAVAAACAVVVKDVEPWTVVGGNPAKVIGKRELRAAPAPASDQTRSDAQ